jgi:hypothetical protein
MHTMGHTACRGWGLVTAIAETARWSHACRRWAIRVGSQSKEISMLWALIVILVVLWLAGFLVVQVGGALIHLLLVIAAIVLIYQVVTGRRAL